MKLRDVVTPMGEKGAFAAPGVAAIYREDGQRVVLLRTGVRGRHTNTPGAGSARSQCAGAVSSRTGSSMKKTRR